MVKMKRYLYDDIIQLALNRHKMVFISGPRQVGKTTLAKSYKPKFDQYIYKNWDESLFRRLWLKSPNLIKEDFSLEKIKESRLLILDEIHKSKGWKQKIKGLYDELGEELNIIVTGSARLNVFKKGGDSLMGRYLNFRLHPLSFGEVTASKILSPEDWKASLFKKNSKDISHAPLNKLLQFSGFPEPFYAESLKILRIWRQGRNEKIIREDLRDLSRLTELSQIEMLASMLSTKVGSNLSVQSLREDLEVAHDTVSRWLKYLSELYYFFELKPWSKSIPRSLKKEGKIYLYDWTEIENEGAKFENLVAGHLLKACHYWTDTGEGLFDLYYLRNKEKQEIDFIIIKDKKPWLCIESKLSETKIDHKSVDKFLKFTKCPFVQIVLAPDIWKAENEKLVASAGRVFTGLP
jgi:predicted AAA+ superfamily ATPase